ncbi:MAG: Hsp33 family molecular chaperone HslO [Desulfuromonadales bacterium]|nr:Hsp33 family molecular chaperone HslO [Desulfuromonadales bacterium]
MQDHLVRAVSQDGFLRGMVAVTTGLVNDICEKQQTDLTATVALGRLLTGGALLGCLLKGKQRLALVIEGNGPLGRLGVETDARGRVRGTIRNPVAGLPPKDGRYDVAGAVGKAGFLHVWKDLGLKEPYRSMVQLQSSEIAEDLAWYLTSSEQLPSSVSLGVELDATGRVAAAGGILIQALPPGDEQQVERIIEQLQQMSPVTSLLRQGSAPTEILQKIFAGVESQGLTKIPLQFYCPCSSEQIAGVLRSLGKDELRRLAEEREEVAVTCEYCRKRYLLTSEQVLALLK